MFRDRIAVLAESGSLCRIFTPFGEATGKFVFYDGSECHFQAEHAKWVYKLYCVDVIGLAELPTVPSEV